MKNTRHISVATLLFLLALIATACNSNPNESPPEPTRDDTTWTTVDGTPVPLNTVFTEGPSAYCPWTGEGMGLLLAIPIGSVVESKAQRAQYIKDPLGMLFEVEERFHGEFEPDTQLPDDAEFTGFVQHGVELWIIPDHREKGIYLVDDDKVEKWPYVDPKIYCR